MDETVLIPSPNWFQVSGLAVSSDGWIVYGGPTKSICFLVPHPKDKGVIRGSTTYKAHVFNRAHHEKIVSIDISPEWPQRKLVLTGSVDGSVKLWDLEHLLETNKLQSVLTHDIHNLDKEGVVGVGYANENFAITVGCFGVVVKWDLKSNIVRTYNHVKKFRPICMSCSPHIVFFVAIGTKQGVVFVLDLNGEGKLVYKVRGQDDEIVNLSWCPKYEVCLKKTFKESQRRGQAIKKTKNEVAMVEVTTVSDDLEASGIEKKLPEDSFDESNVVPDDDIFDIYTDHEADEFGHKKYQPEEISVKVQVETKYNDYLDDCLKLKEEILRKKDQGESTMQSLVDALDSAHIKNSEEEYDSEVADSNAADQFLIPEEENNEQQTNILGPSEASTHIHKHLLATISKNGGIRVWSKTGKLVSSCAFNSNKNQKNKSPICPSVLWYKPDVLLLSDAQNQLLESNPLQLDCRSKLDWKVVHTLHKRNIYGIASNAPRLQTSNDGGNWSVWTTSQDRYIYEYSIENRKLISSHATCGGFLYTIASCPYDAGKIAVSVGDGAVRVWQTSTLADDDTKLDGGKFISYWQNVQGKVLCAAWHPTKENLLAFATAESRIGLIDTSGKMDRPARVLASALSGSVYSLKWGENNDLYACANGDLVVYKSIKTNEQPVPVDVKLEGRKRSVSVALWQPRALLCATHCGCVAALAPRAPHDVLACAHVCSKLIQTVDWHPLYTSNSSEESPCKNLIAVCSMDKYGNIIILEYNEGEDGNQLQTWKTLSGHTMTVLQIMWNPHIDGMLLSTSQDHTVRVWDVLSGVCQSIFAGHSASTLGASWCTQPQLPTHIMSGGGDCCLRMWDASDHPADAFRAEGKHEIITQKAKKKDKKERCQEKKRELREKMEAKPAETDVATSISSKLIGPKRFLLPYIRRMTSYQNNHYIKEAVKLTLKRYLEKNDPERASFVSASIENESCVDYLKMYGSINDVNEILDKEMAFLLEKNQIDAWVVLAVMRGRIDDMVQFACRNDILCPYLVSLTPCVSFKYWKDVTRLYLTQIDRMVAKGQEEKLNESRAYGGAVYRRVCVLLAAHDVLGAVNALKAANLYPEAYLLCRIRYMDSIADETLKEWAMFNADTGAFSLAAICYIVSGDLSEAAVCLGKLSDQESLVLAALIAKIAGRNMLADHVAEKCENIVSSEADNKEDEILKDLPSRIELLMKEFHEKNDASKDLNQNGIPIDKEETKD